MIVPTVGRSLYYSPLPGEKLYDHDQPWMGFLCHLNSDQTINMLVLNESGMAVQKSHLTLAQDREPLPGEAYWMPYQVKTAEKSV